MSERSAVLAQAAFESKDYKAAAKYAQEAVRGGYKPALQLCAAVAYKQGDYRAAIAALEAAEDQSASALTLLIRLHLLAGEPGRGWQMALDCSRAGLFGPSLHSIPRWRGESLRGRRIVAWGAGYGDDIFFARYLPALAATGATVLLNCRQALVRLFRTIEGVAEVAALDTEFAADFHLNTAELPALFGALSGDMWPGGPYVHAEPIALAGSGKRVGIVWASDSRHWESEDRTAALADLSPLAEVPGVRLFSLQVGKHAAQMSPPPAGMAIENLSVGFPDFAEQAAQIAALDLVITVDTAVANLAGALGARVWVAVPCVPDWRWRLDGDRTPWYPSARVYRQPTPGDWGSIFRAMKNDLTAKWSGTSIHGSR